MNSGEGGGERAGGGGGAAAAARQEKCWWRGGSEQEIKLEKENKTIMGLIRFSHTAAMRPCTTTPPPAPPLLSPLDPPISFSHLLSLQDVFRLAPSPAPPAPPTADPRPPLSQLISSPPEQDHSLVETISEDDRVNLLPIIRIAFPGLKSSMHETSPPRQRDGDGRQGAVRMEKVKQEEEVETELRSSELTMNFRTAQMGRAMGEPGESSVRGGQEKVMETGELERNCRAGEVAIQSRAGFAHQAGGRVFSAGAFTFMDKKCVPVPSSGGDNAHDQQIVCKKEQEDQFFGNKEVASSENPRGNKNSESTEADAIAMSLKLGVPNSDSRPNLEQQQDGKSGHCSPNELASNSGRSEYQEEDHLGQGHQERSLCEFPDTICKRKTVIRKAADWLKKKRSHQGYSCNYSSSRFCHKRPRSSGCCTGCEIGSKRIKTSPFSASGTTQGTRCSTSLKLKADTNINKFQKDQNEAFSKDNIIKALPACSPDVEADDTVEGPAQILEQQEESILVNALYPVVLESGSHGVTVCEALRKLIKKGYPIIFERNSHPRSVQVKQALRSSPEFRELENRRFVLRMNNRKGDGKLLTEKSAQECIRGGIEGNGHEDVVAAGQKLQLQEAASELSQNIINGCLGESRDRIQSKEREVERCHKTDGKLWRCSQEAKQGFLYCEHHHRRRSKERMEAGCLQLDMNSVKDPGMETPVSEACTGDQSQILADGSLGYSKKYLQGGEKQQIGRCHRKDGKHWQCSRQAKPGSIYCEHHHGRRSKKKRAEIKASVAMKGPGQDLLLSEVRTDVLPQNLGDVAAMEFEGKEHLRRQGELQPGRCHRSDGKRWQCSRQAKPGFIYCEHHQGRRKKKRAETNGQGETAVMKQTAKVVQAPRELNEDSSHAFSGQRNNWIQGGSDQHNDLSHRTEDKSQIVVGSCSNFPEGDQNLKRCHRTDGKGWQCARQAKEGFNYCEHHQLYLSKRSSHGKSFKKGQEGHPSLSNASKAWSATLQVACNSRSEIPQLTPMCMPSVQQAVL